ncbi:MAG: OmpH family outer membrane protein [Candidatus Kapabacteria bacterium]|nr:OmpH family outer membrane protein [Candidatus Kapabacteria bacterium]
MKNFLSTLVLVAVLVFAAQTATAKELKIGYVESEKVLKDMPTVAAAEKTMTEFKQKMTDELANLQKELETRYANYQKQKAMMAPEKVKTEEEAIQAMNQRLMQLQQEGQNNLMAERNKLLKPILERVKAAVQAVAKKQNLSFVLEKSQANSIILYADDAYDITYMVMDYIKKNKK